MKRRARASIACTECRRKKIRCDTGVPKCKHCISTNAECIYNMPRKAQTPAPKRNRLDVSARLSRIERMLERVLEDGDHDNAMESDISESDELGDRHSRDPVNATDVVSARFYPTPLEDPIYSHGLSCVVLSTRYMDRMGDYVGHGPLFDRLRERITQFADSFNHRTLEKLPLFDITIPSPPVDSQSIQYVQNFLNSTGLSSMNVLITKEEFTSIQRMPTEKFGPYAGTSVLFHATIALVLGKQVPGLELLFSNDTSHYNTQQTARAFKHAIHGALNSSVFRPNLTILRGLLALLSSSIIASMPASVEIFFSRRCMGICADLGLNRRSFYASLNPEDRQRYTKLFWFAYCSDRAISLRIGCPPTMSFSQISTAFPEPEPRSSDLCYLLPSVKLFRLYDMIYERLCSGSAERRSVRQLVRDIMACDQKLEEWYDELEPFIKCAPEFEAQEVTDDPKQQAKRDRIIRLMGSYYYLTICVHRMTAVLPASTQKQLRSMFPTAFAAATSQNTPESEVSREGMTPDQGTDDISSGEIQRRVSRILNSMNICSEAARQLLRLDNWTIQHPEQALATSGRAFDFLNTASTLFMKSVLQTGMQCQSDARLLRETSECLRQDIKDPNELCALTQELFCSTADIIDYMWQKKLSPHGEGTQRAKVETKEAVDGGWTDRDFGIGTEFESLAAELFPEFGFPSPNQSYIPSL